MLRRFSSRTPSFGVFVEHECPRCHREVELPLGEICRECNRALDRKAGRVGRWVAAMSTLAMALYVWLRVADDPTAKMVGIMGIVAWYVLTYLVTKRVVREYLR